MLSTESNDMLFFLTFQVSGAAGGLALTPPSQQTMGSR